MADAPDWAQAPAPEWAAKPEVKSAAPDWAKPKVEAAAKPDWAKPANKPGFIEGAKRGFEQTGLGAVRLADMTGLHPLDKEGKDYIVKRGQQLEKEGKGTGIMGEAGEIAGSPLTYVPLGGEYKVGAKLGAEALAKIAPKVAPKVGEIVGGGALSGATVGGLQGAAAPQLDPNETAGDRLKNAGKGAAVGAAVGVGAGAAGATIANKIANRAARGSVHELESAAIKDPATGQILTGRSHPEIATANKLPGNPQDWHKNRVDSGFVTTDGKFLNRDQAKARYGVDESEQLAAAKLRTPKPGEGTIDKITGAAKAVRNIMSPTSAGPDAKIAEQAIRENFGQARRESATTDTMLRDYEHSAANMTPEQQQAFYHYADNRSTLDPKESIATLSKLPAPMVKFMKPMREEFLKRRDALEKLDKTDTMGFIEDYFPHQYTDQAKAKAYASDYVSKFGSGRATRARTIPTIAEAEAAGLKLKEPNPVKAMSNYVNSMDRYIATMKLIEDGRANGEMLWSNANKPPREGWVALEGPGTRKPAREMIPTGTNSGDTVRIGEQRLFAPPDYARVHNNFASKGLEGTQGAPLYEAARELKNTWTATTLALSGYHFGTIIAEQLGTDFGRIFKNLVVGDLKGVAQAAKSIGSTMFITKSGTYRTGKKLAEQYTGRFDHGIEQEAMADHFAKSGGSLKIDPVYQASKGKDDLWEMIGKGTLGDELKSLGTYAKIGPLQSAKATVEIVARAADTISAPLFKRYIPTIKAGAFSNLMGDWLRQNPKATQEMVDAARIHYQDIVEERFGEMNNDNLFWNQTLKQVSGIMLTARTWDIGLARQVVGPFVDLGKFAKGGFKDMKLTDRAFGLAGLLTASLAMSGAHQFLKTGQLPQTPADWRAPRTGGTIEGQPERVDLPGRLREVKQLMPRDGGFAFDDKGKVTGEHTDYLSGVKSEAYNKLSPPVQKAIAYFTGKDPYKNDIPGLPISAGQLMQGKEKGSNISAPEAVFGIRQAPFRETNPKLADAIAKKGSKKDEQKQLFLDALHKQQYPNDVRNK